MEDSIVAAYIALVIGSVVQEEKVSFSLFFILSSSSLFLIL